MKCCAGKTGFLYLDCADGSYSLIQKPGQMKPFKIAAFFSGLERNLISSDYNLRQSECREAAARLLSYKSREEVDISKANLRDVPREVFEEHKDGLPPKLLRRATHFYTELERTEKGAVLWKKGDIDAYGKLVFESGKSSIENYECGCSELITLYNILSETDGVYGGRFSGAGFKGYCVALIDPEREQEITSLVKEKYLSVYPGLKDKYFSVLCDSTDGVMPYSLESVH